MPLLFLFFLLFCYSIYKMVTSEYSTEDYKSPKISNRAIIKIPEI